MTDGFVTMKFGVHPPDWDGPAAEVESNGDGTAFIMFCRGLGHDGASPIEVTSRELRALAEGLNVVADRLDGEAHPVVADEQEVVHEE